MDKEELKKYLKENLRFKKKEVFPHSSVKVDKPYTIIQLWLENELITSEVLV